MALVVALVLVAPTVAEHIEDRVDLAVLNPDPALLEAAIDYKTDDSLEAVDWLRQHATSGEQQATQAMCAITERDAVIALLLRWLIVRTHCYLADDPREVLVVMVENAKRSHYVLSLSIE